MEGDPLARDLARILNQIFSLRWACRDGLLRNASQIVIVGIFLDTVRNGKKRPVSRHVSM